MSKAIIVERFKALSFGNEPGIGTWLTETMHEMVATRLSNLAAQQLSKVQLNQLLVVSKSPSISDGFFRYYWMSAPNHPYSVKSVEGYDERLIASTPTKIVSLDHLAWGLYRIFIDGLLFFGNVKAGFNTLRSKNHQELEAFFQAKCFDTEAIAARGPSLPLREIARDDRYLISEMACKTFGELPASREAALQALKEGWGKHEAGGGGGIGFKDFLSKYLVNTSNKEQLLLSYDDVADQKVDSERALAEQFEHVAQKFVAAREAAMQNTELYLSMVNDLDVYVATSMRTRKNFRDMADACDRIFKHSRLAGTSTGSGSSGSLHLRHFDPTVSAARGHEDKGLIECLMVKCAKVLVYCEGEKESYGKDAEAAMALSLGKPVVFFCDHGVKTNFYRDIHPLARLIDFRSGVAVGAIVSDDVGQVSELIARIFRNEMEYRIEHHATRPGYLKLIEKLTGSVVRLQTDDELIKKTFWNNYHNRSSADVTSLAAGKETERLHDR